MAPKKKNYDLSGTASKKLRQNTDQSQGSKPQETQPVEKFQDVGDPAMPECPMEDCEWKICDVSSDEGANEVSSLLKKYYLHGVSCDMSLDQDGSNQFEYEHEYSKDYLQWFLCPPGFHKDWHIGVEDKSKKQLVAFIAAVPTNMRLHGKDMQIAEVKFLCVLPKSKELEPLLLTQMARRVYAHSVQGVVFASRDHFDGELIATCQSLSRLLNIKKLFDLKFIKLDEGMTVEAAEVEHNNLLTSPTPHGLRKMEVKDLPSVTILLGTYLGKFDVAPMFNESEVEHWFLPRADIVESYVAESENKDITHFISFATLSFSIIGVNDSSIKSASSLYNVSTKTQPPELLKNAMVLAESNGSDIFEVLNIMDNNDRVLKDLMFGSPIQHHYYRLRKELEPRQVGLVLF